MLLERPKESLAALWREYARDARQEIDAWNAANKELREANPPRFHYKRTDNVQSVQMDAITHR